MTSNPTLRCRWLSRTFGALFVLVALAGTALDAVPAAARETDETPLDLAAMALTPDDLSSAGLDGYGVGDGGTLAPDAVAAAFAFERDIPADDAADLFTDAGLRGAYELQLDVTARGDSHDASVRSTIHEYPDESGAADAFTGLTDWGSSPADVVTLDAPSIGDEAVVVRLVGTTAGRFHALDLTIRTGRLVASVRLVDFTGSEPAMNDATLLGNRLVARIQEGLDETPVGLGGQALRLSGDGVIPIWDYYTAAGGQPVSLAGQSAGEATTADDLADAGVTAEYEVSQRFATVGTMERDTYFYSYVQHFVDDDAASTYLEGTEDRLADNDEFEGLEQIDGLREYGDESIAFSQTFHWVAQDVDLKYERYLLRVDDKVAVIMLIAPDWMPYGALEDLAAAQATCLSEGACDESTRLPATLASMVEDAQGDTAAPDSDRTFPFPSRTRTYVGPTYGVELTYDTADWSVMLEQTADDMDMLGLYEEGTTSMVTFSSYPAFHAADACVADLTSGFADDEAFGRAKPIRNGSGDPIASDDSELAFAAYGLAIDDGSQTFMYLECRSFADDEDTLLITQVGPLDEYSARASARDDLLSGLTLPAD